MRQALGLALVLMLPGGARNSSAGSPQPIAGQYSPRLPEPNTQFNDDPGFAERRLRALNADRQKHMVSEAARLLKLANELNAEVSGANPDSLTPAQLRKVGEIEKLAHSVKERMINSVGDAPEFQEAPHRQIR